MNKVASIAVPFEVDQDGPVAPDLPLCPIVHARHANIAFNGFVVGTHEIEQRARAGGKTEDSGQTSAGLAAQSKSDGFQRIGQGDCLSITNANDGWQALTEDAPGALLVPAVEAAQVQTETDRSRAAGQVLDGAAVGTVQMSRALGTEWTVGGPSTGYQLDDGAIIVRVDRQYTEGG